ncbi:carbonate dehydratase [Xanthomonas massiliensis]|jgi:carbonic anhydrase|uniref:carbonate dehydratase n=1 Tax=Xanthomonas massiliensis TaxID=1720302 RepID=UPI0008255E4E|nr:carbonate dehydratase [Xanthomonas massiliensis]
MPELKQLLKNNAEWAERIQREDPGFFERLSKQQSPMYLWIGCSDSRVPANQILNLDPGEVFVHRNVANVVVHSDLNCLSTVQFAIDVLKVRHILVVGHYGCSGVHAALVGQRVGLADNWLRHVGDVREKHAALLAKVPGEELRHARLCELNAIEQTVNLCHSTVVQDAWARGQTLKLHAWCYSLFDGLVRQLGMDVDSLQALPAAYANALANIPVDHKRD